MACKISVIMPSYLGEYPGCASDRVLKFHRAVQSFINQDYQDKELIIVSDGCPLTISESLTYYAHTNIFVYSSEKQPMFSGNVRDLGLKKSTGDIVCYLDTDDYFGNNHLSHLAAAFTHYPDMDWVYYNDTVVYYNHPETKEKWIFSEREVNLHRGEIGTSSIAHRRMDDISWSGCDGYGHDWAFVNRLIELNKKHMKIGQSEYYVCHIPLHANS